MGAEMDTTPFGLDTLIATASAALVAQAERTKGATDCDDSCLKDEAECFRIKPVHFAWYQLGETGIIGETNAIARVVIEAALRPLLSELAKVTAERDEARREFNLRSSAVTNLRKGAELDALEIAALKAHLAAARPVLEYVSRGRGFIGVDGPYPDATARFVLGAIDDAKGVHSVDTPATSRCRSHLTGQPWGESWCVLPPGHDGPHAEAISRWTDEQACSDEAHHGSAAPVAAGTCGHEYPPGKESRERNPGWHTRIVDCDLPAGHDGDHAETDTGNTWPQERAPADTCGHQYPGSLRQPGDRSILCTLPPHTDDTHREPETGSFWSHPDGQQWASVAISDPRPVPTDGGEEA